MNFELLKKALDRTGLTVIDVAAATRISPKTIERYLTGKHRIRPPYEALLKQWATERLKESNAPDLTEVA